MRLPWFSRFAYFVPTSAGNLLRSGKKKVWEVFFLFPSPSLLIVNHGGQLHKKTQIPEKMLRGALQQEKVLEQVNFLWKMRVFFSWYYKSPQPFFGKKKKNPLCLGGSQRNKDFKIKNNKEFHSFFFSKVISASSLSAIKTYHKDRNSRRQDGDYRSVSFWKKQIFWT